jgi:hypothetical protein
MTLPHFCDYLPFEESLALNLNNLEFLLLKDILYRVWLKLACWFWRRFFKIFSVFLLFRYYLPLVKGVALHMNNSESPPPKNNLCQLCLQLVQMFWRRSWKCKSLTDKRQTSDGRQTMGDQKSSLSFQLRWAKKITDAYKKRWCKHQSHGPERFLEL